MGQCGITPSTFHWTPLAPSNRVVSAWHSPPAYALSSTLSMTTHSIANEYIWDIISEVDRVKGCEYIIRCQPVERGQSGSKFQMFTKILEVAVSFTWESHKHLRTWIFAIKFYAASRTVQRQLFFSSRWQPQQYQHLCKVGGDLFEHKGCWRGVFLCIWLMSTNLPWLLWYNAMALRTADQPEKAAQV